MKIKLTTWIIIINIIFFLFTLFAGALNENCTGICKYIVLQPETLFKNYYIWTLVTSMFMHAGFAHLFFNMFSLFFIGDFVERIIGRKRFFWFYLVSGILAGLFFSVLSYSFGYGIGEKIFGSPTIIAVGASGAIFGLLGLLAVLTPRNRVYLIAGPLIAIIIQAIISNFVKISSVLALVNVLVSIYFLIAIFSFFSFNQRMMKFAIPLELEFWLLPIIAIIPLVIIGLFIQLPIGNMAHLGGLIAGLIFGFYLRRKYPKKVKILNKYFR